MIEGLKPYKDLKGLEKVARRNSGKLKCDNCPIYKKLHGNCISSDSFIACTYAFEKGFLSGVRYHRKQVRKRISHLNTKKL